MKVMVEMAPGLKMALETCGNGCPSGELNFEEKPVEGRSPLRRIRCNFCDRRTAWHGNLPWVQMLWNSGRFDPPPAAALDLNT